MFTEGALSQGVGGESIREGVLQKGTTALGLVLFLVVGTDRLENGRGGG